MPDDVFIMSLRFRMGVAICPAGLTCAHTQCKDQNELCGRCLDQWGDHAVSCNIGAYVSARHSAINDVLAKAGREAGYASLLEQVVPELAVVKRDQQDGISVEEARIDVELFGHPTAPPRLLDGTVRHPGIRSVLAQAAAARGAAAQNGVDAKAKRYPARGGKVVIACAAETWGFIHEEFDHLLADFAVLASQRQRDRGQHPTRWLSRWRTQLSIQIAVGVGKALLAAVPPRVRPCSVLPLGSW